MCLINTINAYFVCSPLKQDQPRYELCLSKDLADVRHKSLKEHDPQAFIQTIEYQEVELEKIEPLFASSQSLSDWEQWFQEQIKNVRLRFGNGPEALLYWPDDYYEKMEQWWISEWRYLEPLQVELVDGVYKLEDGWHRLAISYKNKMPLVPIQIKVKG